MKSLETYIKEALNIKEALRLKKGQKMATSMADGVYLYMKDNNMIPYNNAAFIEVGNIIGIAIVDGNMKVNILIESLKHINNKKYGMYADDLSHTSVTITDQLKDAENDTDGMKNTTELIHAGKSIFKSNIADAAKYCISQGGYLGSYGEWNRILRYKADIQAALYRAGYSNIVLPVNIMTSTAYDNKEKCWVISRNRSFIIFYRDEASAVIPLHKINA